MYFGATFLEVWYKDGLFVKIHDIPGTLSGNILRLQANLPPLDTHSEIIGDSISSIAYKDLPPEEDWDDQNADDVVQQLPVVPFDVNLHFAKECRCINEVQNLLKVKGGPHIVQLLGRTEEGKLVFPLYLEQPWAIFITASISEYKRLLLQLADALLFLHSHGIVHRDVALRNILTCQNRQSLILCDLESRFGSHICPEIALARDQSIPESALPYSQKSDVFCFGTTIADFILSNTVRTPWQYTGNFIPPPPFDKVVRACIRRDPAERLTMLEAKEMLESINASGPLYS
ncbi:hypothetical protein VKT23_017746 [Stygiomarasmius scandens]|uniref:Protein kinase domain-containing protein n=1 Tax=Marasmiellus scandens TaxID=2682957 RepID=A0ABR1ISR3_9AGAR